VTGEGLNEPNAIVSYNIKLTPRSGGEPMTIVDSFPVTPEKDGSFHKTITESWEKFEFRLTGKYTLSGSALLASNLIPIHDIAIRFPRPKLNCGRSDFLFPKRRAQGNDFGIGAFTTFNVWSEKKLWEKLNYMHRNPVERKLVALPKDWPWSSWSRYEKAEKGMLRIDKVR
jgi:hypothetical protein